MESLVLLYTHPLEQPTEGGVMAPAQRQHLGGGQVLNLPLTCGAGGLGENSLNKEK